MALDANILGGVSANRAEVEAATSALRAFFPQRRVTGTVAAINAEVVADINGESQATIWLNGTGTFNATYSVQGSPDGVNYFDILAYPVPQLCVGGTIPQAAQPLVLEAVNAAVVQRTLCVAVGGLQKIRVRLTVYTSGTADVRINLDSAAPLNPYVFDQKAATLLVTTTAATGAAATATLTAVPSLRHYVDRIDITQVATATAAGTATPIVTSSLNLPGLPIFSFGNDLLIGRHLTQTLDFGASGLAATAINTTTSVTAPATTNVIWRITVVYRLGL